MSSADNHSFRRMWRLMSLRVTHQSMSGSNGWISGCAFRENSDVNMQTKSAFSPKNLFGKKNNKNGIVFYCL